MSDNNNLCANRHQIRSTISLPMPRCQCRTRLTSSEQGTEVGRPDCKNAMDRPASSSVFFCDRLRSLIVHSSHPSPNMARALAANFTSVPEVMRQSVQATKAEFRLLGRSGLRVSNPILGGLQIGSPKWLPWVLDEEKVSNTRCYEPLRLCFFLVEPSN